MDLERACIVLGVERGTPVDEAKKRYRARARLLHPDVASNDALRGEAAQAFQELTAAWEIYKQHGLSDSEGAADTRRPQTSDPSGVVHRDGDPNPQWQAQQEKAASGSSQTTSPRDSSAPSLSAQDVRNTRFTAVPRGEGFEMRGIDDVLDTVEGMLLCFEEGGTYKGMDPLAHTVTLRHLLRDIQRGKFRRNRLREGYDKGEVHTFLGEAKKAINQWQA